MARKKKKEPASEKKKIYPSSLAVNSVLVGHFMLQMEKEVDASTNFKPFVSVQVTSDQTGHLY